MATTSPLAEPLAALRRHYAQALPDKLAALRQALLQISRQHPPQAALLDDAIALAHRLRGTAGSYGFHEISAFAQDCEQALVGYRQDATQLPRWEELLAQLARLRPGDSEAATVTETPLTEAGGVESDHILVVDDDPDFLDWLAQLLSDCGFRVTTTTDAHQAIPLLQARSPDLVLLDVEMPVMSGFALCQQIRSHPQWQEIPIIFLTAHNSVENRIAAFQARAHDFINKPIVKEELLARISIRLERARLRRERQRMLLQLQQQHEVLLSILNQLRISSILLDAEGHIVFISTSCGRIGLDAETALGQSWRDVLPLNPSVKGQFQRLLALTAAERTRLPVKWNVGGTLYWIECEIQDDPQDVTRRLVYFYDISEVQRLRQQLERSRNQPLKGNSQPMRELYRLIEQVARGNWTVLIEGETGVGKELVARSIHAASPRKEGPFIAINSAGLSESLLASQLFGHRRGAFTGAVADQEGFFEAASGGTLFLDEIGDLPLDMQASLLRVLQEKEIIRLGENHPRKVDVRIIAATHKDLSSEVQAGRFRADLLYRLRVARLYVPALREHKEDIPLLVQIFLQESSQDAGKPISAVSPEALRQLIAYNWPGNVRELRAAIDYAVIHSLGTTINPDDLPPELRQSPADLPPERRQPPEIPSPSVPPLTATDEQTRLSQALEQTRGNRRRAAQLLGISRATLYRRLAEWGFPPKTGS